LTPLPAIHARFAVAGVTRTEEAVASVDAPAIPELATVGVIAGGLARLTGRRWGGGLLN